MLIKVKAINLLQVLMLKNQSTFVYIGNIHSNEISLNVKVTGIT